ncbi:MAG: N-6 DNA methylase [Sulfolobales archaeon]
MKKRECSSRVEDIYTIIYRYLGSIVDAIEKGILDVEVYTRFLQHLYPRSSKNELLEIVSAHISLQILMEVILGRYVGGYSDIDSICYGDGLERYGVSLDLLRWRSILDGYDLFERICRDLVKEVADIDASEIAFGDLLDRLYSRLVGKRSRYYSGEYYTPPWVANIAIDRVNIYSGGLVNKVAADPACGSGIFLAQMLRARISMGEDPFKAFQNIWGIDINPIAVIISRARMLVAFKTLTGLDPREPPRIFLGDFIGSITEYIESLHSYRAQNILWLSENQKIKGKGVGMADIVVTNPPWLELNELPRNPWGMHVRRYVRDSIIRSCGDKIPSLSRAAWKGDLSAVFLDLSLRLVGRGGVIGILLPANQSYSGSPSPHGAGKLLTLAVIKRWGASGEILYLGDVFGHGIHASLAVLRRGLDLPEC